MRDANQENPLHHLGGNGRHSSFDDDALDDEGGFQEPGEASYSQYGAPPSPQLPGGRFGKAVTIGLIAGLLCAIQSIVITLLNASTYRAFATSGTHQTV